MEKRPSFSPPRRDLRPPGVDPGANEIYTERLDTLNNKFQRLLEQLSQRLRTAIEVSGADGLVSRILCFIKNYELLRLSTLICVWGKTLMLSRLCFSMDLGVDFGHFRIK